MTKESIVKKISEFVYTLAEGRCSDGVDVNKSLLNDYSFSSIDIMDLLLNIRDEYFSNDENLDAENLLSKIYNDYENSTLSVISFSEIVCEMLNIKD